MIDTQVKNPLAGGRVISVNTDPKVYHGIKGERGKPDFIMSRGELVQFARCPRRWLLGVEAKDTDATVWGSLLDCMFLTPEGFKDRFAIKPLTCPDTKTGEPKPFTMQSNWCKEWAKEQGDKVIVSKEDADEVCRAINRLGADEHISALMKGAYRQVMIMAEYQDSETGIAVPLKGMIDILPHNVGFEKTIADLKTCRSAAPRKWQRDVFENSYHVQAALYLDIYNAATNEERTDFLHVLSENEPPYETGRRLLSSEFIDLGRATYMSALKFYCRCLKANDWPGYDENTDNIDGWTLVQPEAWMMMQ